MRNYLKFVGLFYGSVALAALVVGLVAAFGEIVGFGLAAFGLLSASVALFIGAVIFLIHGLRCARQLSDPLHQAVVALASPVLTVVVTLAMLPLVVLGFSIGDLANWTR